MSLVSVERVAAIVTTTVGCAVAIRQLAVDGWTRGGGTGWLLATAVIATIGTLLVVVHDGHAQRCIGLLAVVASPTVFAYLLNIVLLGLGLAEFALTIQQWRRTRTTPAAG